jgi:hypothetical protein
MKMLSEVRHLESLHMYINIPTYKYIEDFILYDRQIRYVMPNVMYSSLCHREGLPDAKIQVLGTKYIK